VNELFALFLSAFVTLLVVIDPPGCAPIYASLTRDCPPAQRRAMAIRAVLVALGILLFFGLLGEICSKRWASASPPSAMRAASCCF
jgi:multiple antibiotic resistance protein